MGSLALLIAAVGAHVYYAGRHSPSRENDAGPIAYSASPQQQTRTLGLVNKLPPDAPAVVYIDAEALRKLQGSTLPALLGLTRGDAAEDREYQQFVRETGFDYTRDLDQGTIAFWPGGFGQKAQGGPGGNRAVVIADGRFDEKRIRAYALKSGKMHSQGTHAIYEIPGKPPVSVEFLSPTRIQLTSGPPSNTTAGPSPGNGRDAGFQARIARVAGAPIFAAVRTDKLPASVYASFHNSPQIEALARSVRSLTLAAQPQGDILKMTLDGESSSAKDALAIATLAEISRMGAAMALSDPKTSAQPTAQQAKFLDALLRKATIERKGRWVRITLDVTPQMLSSGQPATPGANAEKRNPAK